jgi:hypothetical protein
MNKSPEEQKPAPRESSPQGSQPTPRHSEIAHCLTYDLFLQDEYQ